MSTEAQPLSTTLQSNWTAQVVHYVGDITTGNLADLVPHTYILLTDPNGNKHGYGLAPASGLSLAGNGKIYDNTNHLTNSLTSFSDEAILTPQEYSNLAQYINNSIANPPYYNVGAGKECTNWVVSGLNAAIGVNPSSGGGLPTGTEDLIKSVMRTVAYNPVGLAIGENFSNFTGSTLKNAWNNLAREVSAAAEPLYSVINNQSTNPYSSFQYGYVIAKPTDFSGAFRSFGYSNDMISAVEEWGFNRLGLGNSYLDNSFFNVGSTKWSLLSSTSLLTLPSIPYFIDPLAGYEGDHFAPNPFIRSWNGYYFTTQNRRSPLTLDLDGDGVETTSMDNGVFFDIDNDNYAEKVGWVSADDGLLAMDVNNDGQINNITELYGDDIMPAFQKLALHDSNKNGKIDQGDADYSKLLVWRDLNQDGHTDSGETQTLEQAGVKEISLAERNVDTYQNENYFSTKATYTKFDNTTRDIVDVHFLNDNVNTWFMGAQSQVYGSTYQVKAEALLLPLSRGYGSLASLHIAMTNDDVLLSQMEELAALKAEDFGTLSDKMTAFLYQWAGVQDNDPEARATGNGSNIDARKVDFLEQFTGVEWAQMGAAALVGDKASLGVKKIWNEIANLITARILVQGALHDTIFSNASYDFKTDSLSLHGESADTMATIIARAQSYISGTPAQAHDFWLTMGNIFVQQKDEWTALGITGANDAAKIAAISSAIDAAYGSPLFIGTQSLTISDGPVYTLKNETGTETLTTNVQLGGSGNDVITGSGAGDYIFGAGGNDTLDGAGGDDFVRGDDGTDTLVGGVGDDRLEGSGGNDILNGGDGRDDMNGGAGNDTLTGGAGNDKMNGGAGADFLDGGAGSNEIDYLDSPSAVYVNLMTHQVEGGDAVGDTFQNIQNIDASEYSDVLIGDDRANLINGENGSDIIYGGDGDDQLFGAEGEDTLYGEQGNDRFDGFEGAEYMDGGAGTDTVSYEHPYNTEGVYVSLEDGKGYVGAAEGDQYVGIENVIGSEHSDMIVGDAGNNALYGNEGVDLLIGGAGNDYLDAGEGGSILIGGSGSDTFVITPSVSDYAQIIDFNPAQDVLDYRKFTTDVTSATSIDIAAIGNDTLLQVDGANRVILKDVAPAQLSISNFVFHPSDTMLTTVTTYTNTDTGVAQQGDQYGNILKGTFSADTISGLAGDDNILGLEGDDTLSGGAGNDTLTGGMGADALDGGADVDIVDYRDSYAGVTVNLTTGAGTGGTAEGDTLSNIESVEGSVFDDVITGNSGNNILSGNVGNDTLYAKGGVGNIMVGGAGNDTFVIDQITGTALPDTGVPVLRDNGDGTVTPIGGAPISITYITDFEAGNAQEKIDLSAFTLTEMYVSRVNDAQINGEDINGAIVYLFNGTDSQMLVLKDVNYEALTEDNFILPTGFSFSEVKWQVLGTNGDDIPLLGSGNNDTVFAMAGQDFVLDGKGSDVIYGNPYRPGLDDLSATITPEQVLALKDMQIVKITKNAGDIDVIANYDSFIYAANGWTNGPIFPPAPLTVGDIDWNNANTVAASQNLFTRIDLRDFADIRAGNDLSMGYADTNGNGSNDATVLLLPDGQQVILANFIPGEVKDWHWSGGGYGTHAYSGGTFNGWLSEAKFDAWIEGGIIFYDGTLTGTNGDDVLEGGYGVDEIIGGAGDDVLTGEGDNDTLLGGSGKDTLNGGAGNDTLTGGDHGDTFVVGVEANATDTITDFEYWRTDEKIDLTAFNGQFSNFIALKSGISQQGADTHIALGNGQKIVLQNFTATKLTANNFVGGVSTNNAPAAKNDALSGSEDQTVVGNLLVNNGSGADTDPDSDPLSVISGSFMTENGGAIVISANGNFTYTPAQNFNGTDTYYYSLSDGLGGVDMAKVAFTVASVNDAPVAQDDAFTMTMGSVLSGNLFDNNGNGTDSDVDGSISAQSASITTANRGTVVIQEGGEFTYTPAPDFIGVDTFNYTLKDPQNLTDIGVVSISVQSALPVISGTTAADTLTGTASAEFIRGLDGNDSINALEGNDIVSGGSGNDTLNGGAGEDVLIGGAGNDSYIVDNFNDIILENVNEGTDSVSSSSSFTLDANVENLTLTGTDAINATGNAANNVLTGNSGDNILSGGAGNDTLTGGAGADNFVIGKVASTTTTVTDFTLAQTGERVDLTAFNGDYANFAALKANISQQGANAQIVLVGGQTLILQNVTASSLTRDDFIGNANINSAPVAKNDILAAMSAVALTGNLLVNNGNGVDSDPDGDALSITAGTFSTAHGSVVIQSNGGFTYTSAAGYTGADSFSYPLQDGQGGTATGSAQVTVSAPSVINGTAGDDILNGTSGNETINGLAGNDTINGGAGADTLVGGTGNDIYIVDSTTDLITENASEGTDTVQSSVTFTLASLANIENLTLTGTSAINATGNAANNVVTGNSGNNTLDGGTGADTLIGGAGNDTYVVDNTGDIVTEAASSGTDLVQSSATFTLSAEVENLTLTGTSAINGTGNALNNTITGNSGNNALDGGAGTDTLAGGTGNDTYLVDTTTDTITENAGEGTDTVQSSVTFSLAALANVENITLAGTSAINATGNAANNVLTGNSGVNTLDGGAGTDTLVGGTGNDVYIVDSTTDTITENASGGTDTVQSSVTFTLAALTNVENLTLTGTNAINATGNTGNNVLIGNSAVNTLDGGAGTDTLIGGTGNDTYILDSTTDTITENTNEGTDTVQSSVTFSLASLDNIENLTLTGAGTINATGNAANNVLIGNVGDNILSGGAGNDTLTGGAGADTFVIGKVASTTATITDFAFAQTNERIDLTAFNSDYANFTALKANIAPQGANAQIALAGGQTLILQNVTASSLTRYDFIGNANINSAPVAQTDVLAATAAVALTGNLLVNNGNGADSDPDGDTLSVTAGTFTTPHGSVIIQSNGGFSYTSTAGYTGADSFSYTLQDGQGEATTGLAQITVSSGVNIINGTSGNDTLNGTVDVDQISGLDGNDTLNSLEGNDTLDGGAGNDTLTGGAGDDTLSGGDGDDVLNGGSVNTLEIQAILAANSGVRYSLATGNFYRYVSTAVLHDTAFINAAATTLNGVNGHLVTITSAEENAFVTGILGNRAWIGATDTGVEGEWRWTVGPEAGALFWLGTSSGTSQNGFYQNWLSGEPNDYNGSEDHGEILTSGLWNDHNSGQASGYVIEWEGSNLLTTGGAALFGGNDTLTGGNDADTFVIGKVAGVTDTITDFVPGEAGERIDLSAFNSVFTNFAALRAIMTQQGADTHIALGDGQTLVLQNVTTLALMPGDFTGSAGYNAVPVANTDEFIVEAGTGLTGNLLVDNGNGADSDPEGSALSVTAGTFTTAQGGVATVLSNGNFTYTPAISFTGNDTFTYMLLDGYGGVTTGSVQVAVEASVVEGTSGDDVLTGTVIDEMIYGCEGDDTLNGGAGDDTLYGDGHAGEFLTLVSSEDFESGATGWNNNTTEAGGANFTTLLGRFAGGGGAQTLYKTYALSGAQDSMRVSFDFYEIDSWDTGERFALFVDDVQVFCTNFYSGGFDQPADGTFGNVSWTVDELTLVNQNLGFSGQWLSDQKFRYTLEIATTGTELKLGFGNTLNQAISDESMGIDNVTVSELQSPPARGMTDVVVFSEDFESGATGWNNNTTEDGGTNFTTVLGRFSGGGGAQTLCKTYALSGEQESVTVSFDFYEIDSWDSEAFRLFVNDTQIFSRLFDCRNFDQPADGSFENVSWTVEELNSASEELGFTSGEWWSHDQMYRYTLEIATAGTELKLGFGNTLNQSITDEAMGIDNVIITEHRPDIVGGNDTLVGGAGDDILIGGAGDDVLYGDGTGAAGIQAILEANPGLAYSSDTGNFYQYVSRVVSYDTAFANAAAATLNGVNGHLVTITSAAENTFVDGISGSVWIGATDTVVEGEWRWITGPEAGTLFWLGASSGSSQNGFYENWKSGEPNDYGSSEDYGELRSDGLWNDKGSAQSIGYVIEWEGSDMVSSGSDNLIGGAGDDILVGGGGLDTLTGGTGADTFVFEAAMAYNNIDVISDFSTAQNDVVDIGDLMGAYTPGVDTLSNFVRFVNSGSDSLLQVDRDGTGATYNFQTVTQLNGTTNLDASTLAANGNLLAS